MELLGLSREKGLSTLVRPYSNQGGLMEDIIFRAEGADILGVNPKTFDGYAARWLKPAYKKKRKNGVVIKGYKRADVVDLKKKMRKTRKPGLPLIISEE